MLKCGWLSPDCKLHECRYSDHMPFSHELVEQYKIQSPRRSMDDDALRAAGWFKITRRLALGNGGIYVGWPMQFDDNRTMRVITFLKKCITPEHRAFFREAYFNDPSDWDIDTIDDFLGFGILEKDEVVIRTGMPEWMLRKLRG